MYISVDIDTNELFDELEPLVQKEARLECDAEITKQFESIQKELESVVLQHVNEKISNITINLIDTINERLNSNFREHVDLVVNKTVRDQIRNLRLVPYDTYLESGEGREGKERAMMASYGKYTDEDIKRAESYREGGCDARDTL